MTIHANNDVNKNTNNHAIIDTSNTLLTTPAEQIKLMDHERQACEVWTRVMGYHRPVSAFNKGKKSEHQERLHFNE